MPATDMKGEGVKHAESKTLCGSILVLEKEGKGDTDKILSTGRALIS